MPKSAYEENVQPYLKKIERWATMGATAKDIAQKLGVAYSTFRKYLKDGENGNEKYRELSDCFKTACEEPDDEVELALFRRATGYDYEEVTYEPVKDKETGEVKEICTKRVKKHMPPETGAAVFWLSNRRPEVWSQKVEATVKTGVEELLETLAKEKKE